MSTGNLFADEESEAPLAIAPRSVVLRHYALSWLDDLLPALKTVTREAPFRHMATPGGRVMSVALTSCGELGWFSDARGYRYTRINPDTTAPWPSMPSCFHALARSAASTAGFPDYRPDACLINLYRPGARLSLHQDRDERDFSAPIVSVSLGMSALFLFGGLRRSDPVSRIPLEHGDVVVWGGEDRLRYHGILPLAGPPHPLLGERRINLTFRKAG